MFAPWERERVSNNADRGWEGANLYVDIFFSLVSGREQKAFKDPFIIIFLC